MAVESATRRTRAIAAAELHTSEKFQQKQINRKMIKQHQLDAKEIAQESKNHVQDEQYFTEIAAKQFFAQSEKDSTLQQTREAIPASLLELYETGISDAEMATNTAEISYLAGEEIESLLSFMDVDGKKKAKFSELSEKLQNAGEGSEEGIIDTAARTLCENNKSEIYLMLCYLLEDLSNKKTKEKLQERLKKIIKAFERQESAYLFNFFSFQNVLKNAPQSAVKASVFDKMANISSGHLKLDSLRHTLQFVTQTLPDKDMYRMVSVFMKFQAKNLKKISSLTEGREDKEELSQILQQERNLIILNSIFNQCRRLMLRMKKYTEIDEKYGEVMTQVITVIESSLVSLDGLQKMTKTMGIQNLTLEANRSFIKNFHSMLSKIPQPVFYSDVLRDKLLDSVKNIIVQIEKLMEPQNSGLSFLRKKAFRKGSV